MIKRWFNKLHSDVQAIIGTACIVLGVFAISPPLIIALGWWGRIWGIVKC